MNKPKELPTLSAAITGGPGEGYAVRLFTLPAFPATFPPKGLRRSSRPPVTPLCAAIPNAPFSREGVSLPFAR